MTLIVSIATRDSIWTLADRQLTSDGTIAATDARKVIGVDSTDGLALIGYAGRGPISGRDPSDWVTSVIEGIETDLRGYVTGIAAAMSAVPAAERSAEPGHLFIASGVVDGQPVLYSVVSDSTGRLSVRYFQQPSGFMLAGSGGVFLKSTSDQLSDDATELLDWIRRAETQEAHPREVTDRLVKWNARAKRGAEETGSRAIVAYRFVSDGEVAPRPAFYDRTKLEPPDSKIPQITRGVDVNQIFDLMKKQAMGGVLSPKEMSLLASYKKAESER